MPKASFAVREASVEDSAAIASIYNEGMDERQATFNTAHVSVDEMRADSKKHRLGSQIACLP